MNEKWKLKKQPASLEARFEFSSFDDLRTFLDEMAEQADLLDHHPNISFGRSHAAVIIYSKTEELNDVDFELVKGIDEAFLRVSNSSQGALV
ncbi:4a-hydroxytetrahydrobiopterin dehydratase [Hydrogenovibrio sp. 3SP14C1]|uniref:4a-hydroxytetrahydrobiopterin dehydratase n=1 Tax=Hydrogenovibrio sp. 3SP14C1 TaxID=3038774 RepID=UPI002415B800|nr:4a-hydroxytetrahydrobiopterin dehydratase [Hydrogenovibrio sp. 3SP14C1]MDG4812005.1 4a-hydroxytetrahydrobiopterin dehydratase [Hydrogenovibrio sp. 3SP14C1]